MKNILLLVAAIGAIAWFVMHQDPFPGTVYFAGQDYELGEATGNRDLMKTYQYTQSGKINGTEDFVQVFVIKKSAQATDYLRTTETFIQDQYQLKSSGSGQGSYGVFRAPGANRDFYAYAIKRETDSAYWLLTFVVQSNFGENRINREQARQNRYQIITALDNVFRDVSF